MTIQPDMYDRSLETRAQQSRQVLVLALVSKLALVVLLGVIYLAIRFIG